MNIKLLASILAASSVISLAYIQSLAADYSDVSQSDGYYQAVNNLSNLNVINGYDDGTFKPDREVSRAEITKMIFSAFRPNATSEVNAAKGHDTQFKDVPGTHWASGYISVGTKSELGFINGYSSSSFGPEDTVTYSQAIKMLVSALGYNSEAEKNGGWPSGYLKQGSSLGLSLPNVSNSQPLNRAQVAVLLDMAIKINNGESVNTNSQNDVKKNTSENPSNSTSSSKPDMSLSYSSALKTMQSYINDMLGTEASDIEIKGYETPVSYNGSYAYKFECYSKSVKSDGENGLLNTFYINNSNEVLQ